MTKVVYQKTKGKDVRRVEVDEAQAGTRRILENGGFKLVRAEPETEPVEQPGFEALAEAGIQASVITALEETYQSLDDLLAAGDEELLAIDGIGQKSLKTIRGL